MDINNFEKETMVRDGNCLFRACAYFEYEDQNQHQSIRDHVVRHVIENFKNFKEQLDASCDANDMVKYDNAKKYIETMGKLKTFGTSFELGQYAKLYGKNIKVFEEINGRYHLIATVCHSSSITSKFHYVLFSGSRTVGHVDVLKRKKSDGLISGVQITTGVHTNLKDDTKNKNNRIIDDKISKDIERHSEHADSDSSGSGSRIMPYEELHRDDGKNTSSSDCNVNDDEVSQNDETDEDNQSKTETKESETTNIPNSSITKKKKIPISYEYNVGSIKILTETMSDERNNLRTTAVQQLLKTFMFRWKIYCPLVINIRTQKYRKSMIFYGYCSVANHGQRFKFSFTEIDSNIFNIYCYSSTQIKKKCQLVAEQANLELPVNDSNNISYGIPQQIPKYKIISEELLPETVTEVPKIPTVLADLIQLWSNAQLEEDRFYRFLELPLHAMMFSKRQLEVLDDFRSVKILHLDATGANVRPIEGLPGKHIFYYVFVYRAIGKSIPLCELITSEHNIPSISKLLSEYKDFILSVYGKWPFFNAVVTDWSWVFMNSILKEWNNTTMNEYLEDTYLYVTKQVMPKPMTFILSCSAHIMNRVSKKLKKSFKNLTNERDFFMDSVALMILARSIEEIDVIFENFMSTILTKNKNTAQELIKNLTEEKSKKKDIDDLLNYCNSSKTEEEEEEEEEEEDELEEEVALSFDDKKNSVYKNSPFYLRYLEKLQNLELKFRNEKMPEKKMKNKYYAPKFALYLLQSFMPYCSLWSAMLMNLVDSDISCVTNAYAESHMKRYSYTLLKHSKMWTVPDVLRILKKNVDNLVKESRLLTTKEISKLRTTNYALYRTTTLNSLDMKIWERKEGNHNKKNIKKRKVSHITGYKLKHLKEKLENPEEHSETDSESSSTDDEIIEAEQGKNSSRKKKVIKNNQLRKKSKMERTSEGSYLDNRQSAKSEGEKKDDIKLKVVVDNLQQMQLKNGTLNDMSYYLNLRSDNIKISYFEPKSSLFEGQTDYIFTARQYRETISMKGLIDGEVIDMFALTQMKNWQNVSYFATNIGCDVLGDQRLPNFSSKETLKFTNNFSNVIIMPYSYKDHWRLLVIDQTRDSLELLDPYERVTDLNRVQKAFENFINKNIDSPYFEHLKNKKWTINISRNRPTQSIHDKWNSSVYTSYYIQCIGNQSNMNEEFDPVEFRGEIINSIMINSDNLQNRCIFCLKTEKIKGLKIINCAICKRWLHKKCISYDQLDTDDEERVKSEEFDYDPISKSRMIFEKLDDIEYRCRACRKYISRIENN